MVESVVIDGEEYRKINGHWVDSTYCIPPQRILVEIYKALVDVTDLTKYSDGFLEKYLAELKTNGLYMESLTIIKYLLPKYEKDKNIRGLRYILPVYTSCLRLSGNPKSAVQAFNRARELFGREIISTMLATSVAAAYCDLEEFEKAQKFCNMAYALQDRTQGGRDELSLVYKRIENHLK